MQDCSLNGIAFIQIAPRPHSLSCPNLPQSTLSDLRQIVEGKVRDSLDI